jgi:peptide/nickel transport system ATP-binding protein
MPTKDVLVEINDLHTYFHLAEGVVRAVDGVNLTIKAGQTLGVVGESGCGKSVTALSLMRLIQPPGRIEGGQIIYYKTMQATESSVTTLSTSPSSKPTAGRCVLSVGTRYRWCSRNR